VADPDDPVSAAWNALAGVYDPELYLDVVSLGLVYGVRIDDGVLVVEMTMTTPGCPVSESLPEEARAAVGQAAGRRPGRVGSAVGSVDDGRHRGLGAWLPRDVTVPARRRRRRSAGVILAGARESPRKVLAMAADLQLEAKALGDPTRHRLFRYIADAQAPVTVAELTVYAGLNHNAIRQHLAVLKDAGLVTEEAERRDRPGRPRLLYRLHPEAAGEWGTPGAYAWLAGLLQQEISRRGFRPARADRGAVIEFTLGRCPFAEVAAADPDTICRLHLGLAEGLTEGLGGLTTQRLTVRPAHRAGCRLTVRRAAAEPRISA
jgi:metal-sulfur cluster biosynthetic enzyme/predicted ArsR family transcriptional regulator